MGSIALGHIFVVYMGQKDPHISTMIMAFGQSRHISNNIYKSKGNKPFNAYSFAEAYGKLNSCLGKSS